MLRHHNVCHQLLSHQIIIILLLYHEPVCNIRNRHIIILSLLFQSLMTQWDCEYCAKVLLHIIIASSFGHLLQYHLDFHVLLINSLFSFILKYAPIFTASSMSSDSSAYCSTLSSTSFYSVDPLFMATIH